MVSDISQGKMTVAKYKRFFYSLPIVGERTEQQLILLAKAGLKEEIRDALANAAAQAPITAVANVLASGEKR
ncbi:unnamed protein product [Brassica oleracea var. botrytis]